MADHGLMLLRIALGIVFFWFGALKLDPGSQPGGGPGRPDGRTPDRRHGRRPTAVPILALWEVAIGVGLLIGRCDARDLVPAVRPDARHDHAALPVPERDLRPFPWAPTLEGQYIIKNIVIVAAAIVLGATVRGGELSPAPVVATAPTSLRDDPEPGT